TGQATPLEKLPVEAPRIERPYREPPDLTLADKHEADSQLRANHGRVIKRQELRSQRGQEESRKSRPVDLDHGAHVLERHRADRSSSHPAQVLPDDLDAGRSSLCQG